jgi:hypothetical protein
MTSSPYGSSSSSPVPLGPLHVDPRTHTTDADARRVLDRLDEEQQDLALTLQWIGQAIDGIPDSPRNSAAIGTLHTYLRDLSDVRDAASRTLAAAKLSLDDADVAALLAPEGALVTYFSGLYEWCEQLVGTFEQLAKGLRREEPIWPVFQYRLINRSFARFEELTSVIQESVHRLLSTRASHPETLRALDHRIEELFWAATWLHVSLTRRFGA